jgi:hypothetical protein
MKFWLSAAVAAGCLLGIWGLAVAEPSPTQGAVEAVKVLRPAEGDHYKEGTAVDVQWQLKEISPSHISFFLVHEKQAPRKIGEFTAKQGLTTWRWRKAGPPGSDYSIQVEAIAGKTRYTGQSKAFDIVADPNKRQALPRKPASTSPEQSESAVTAQGIDVQSPNGGETLIIGGQWRIRWLCAKPVPAYTIELSRDHGKRWEVIQTDVVANADRFDWTITGPTANECLLRVTGGKDGPVGQSPKMFRIVGQQATPPQPAPGRH